MGENHGVVLVSSDVALAELLASSTLIARTWPRAGGDVCLLVHLLRVSVPSLAEALSAGLVLLADNSLRGPELTLTAGTAVIHGLAQTKDGDPIGDPKRRANEVVRIEVIDVVAEGRSARKVTR
jgi:hypothetical protein